MATATATKQRHTVKRRGDAAAFFGVSQATVKDWEMRGCPGMSRDRYDLQSILHWCKENVWRPRQHGETAGEHPDNKDESEAELKRQKLREDIEAKRIANQTAKGKLVLKAAILAAQTQQNATIRSRIEAISGELASQIPPDLRSTIVPALDQKLKLILTELSRGKS